MDQAKNVYGSGTPMLLFECPPGEKLLTSKSGTNIDQHLLSLLGICRIFNYAEYQIDYLLGACGRSLVSGYGSGYPTYVWHKYSYNAYIDWPLRGQYSFYGNVRGPWTTPTTGPDGPIYVQVSPAILGQARHDACCCTCHSEGGGAYPAALVPIAQSWLNGLADLSYPLYLSLCPCVSGLRLHQRLTGVRHPAGLACSAIIFIS